MSTWNFINFQDSNSFSMMELFSFHDYIIVVMSGVVILVVYIMMFMLVSLNFYKNFSESTLVEIVWSVLPFFLLIFLVIPSMKILYLMEDHTNPSFTVKILAHQWYWTYLVPFFNNISFSYNNDFFTLYEFDSFMDSSLYPRLLSCDSYLNIPVNTSTRLLISSSDVIHSFSVPSLGLKVDAMPGRINQIFSNPNRLGLFFGQCSEICGSNHSFMPISLIVSDYSSFILKSKTHTLDYIMDNFSFNLKI